MNSPATAPAQRRPHWFTYVLVENSLCYLGHYAVMAILSLFLIQSLDLPALQAGGILLFASLSFRLSRVFAAPVANRLPIRRATYLSLFLTSSGYLGLFFAKTLPLVLLLLLLVGIGHGTNALLVKTMVANEKTRTNREHNATFLRYSLLATGINLMAAIGSFAGSTLLAHSLARSVFILASGMYALSGLITLGLPSPEPGQFQPTNWSAGLRASLRVRALWQAWLAAALGWFLYTQLYATLPLFVSEGVHRLDLLGTMFALNALLVVLFQLPISKVLAYIRLPVANSVSLAFLSFTAGFAFLWLVPAWQMVYLSVSLWTLGEILLMPALDTLVALGGLAEYKQVAFALNSVATSLGEGSGNLVGLSLAGWFLLSGNVSALYAVLSLCACVALIIMIGATRVRSHKRAHREQ